MSTDLTFVVGLIVGGLVVLLFILLVLWLGDS